MKNFYTSALLLLVSSLTFAQQPYYNNIDFTQNGAALKQALATKITNTHTKNLSYSQIWDALKVVDENPDNSSQVLLIYGHQGLQPDNIPEQELKIVTVEITDNGTENIRMQNLRELLIWDNLVRVQTLII